MSKRKKGKRFSPDSSIATTKPGSVRSKKVNLNATVAMIILVAGVVGFGALLNFKSPGFSKGRNAVLAQPLPTPDYAASKPVKEYVHAANGRLLAVSEPVIAPPTDLAVWRRSTGTWWILDQDGSNTTQAFGLSSDEPAPGDYDGDGKTDFCIYRPSEGKWYLLKSGSNNTLAVHAFGNNGDKPAPADYNGDGKTEFALFRPSTNTWYLEDTTQGYLGSVVFGTTGDQPVPSDYDGDGKADIAVWRDSGAAWYVLYSSDNSWAVQQWGASGDKPVPGDYS